MDGIGSRQWLKRLGLWAGIFLAGVALGTQMVWLMNVWQRRHNAGGNPRGAVTITLTATIDGSDRFIFTPDIAYDEHGRWGPPQNVVFNSQPWTDLTQPPPGWPDLVKDLDLGKATLLTRKGRDVIALETTSEGFDLVFADTQMGAGEYEVTISIPKK